jgi:hypothetical protein
MFPFRDPAMVVARVAWAASLAARSRRRDPDRWRRNDQQWHHRCAEARPDFGNAYCEPGGRQHFLEGRGRVGSPASSRRVLLLAAVTLSDRQLRSGWPCIRAAVTAIPVDDPPSAPIFAQEGAPTATPGYLSIDEYTLCTTTQLDLTPWRVACLEAEISR